MPTYTNLITNPQPVNGGGWGVGGGIAGTQSILTDATGPAGNNARRLTISTAPATVTGGIIHGPTTTGAPVSGSAAYSAAGYVRVSRAQRMMVRVQWVTAAGAISATSIDGTHVVVAANTWTAVEVENVVSPADAATARLNFYAVDGTGGSLWQVGDLLDVQAATVVAGATLPQPFHGGMSATSDTVFAWTGAADASTSTMTVTESGLAAPTGLLATAVSSTQIDVTWNAVTGATGYDVERDGVVVATGKTGTTYSATGLTPLTEYSFRVRSVS